ncbi:MAG: hypothetical protein MJ136_02770 [Clostridia bacterium]|nr:hypothetical protein [Clostridia bacterium]
MKKLMGVLLFLVMTLSCASAGNGFYYSTTRVTTCESSNSMLNRFFESGELSVTIPGLAEGLVPQGVSYIAEGNLMLFAGYRSDKGASALIAVDMETDQVVREVFLRNVDGSVYNGHAGGVCVTEKNIFVANNHHLYRISLEKFFSLQVSDTCAFEEAIPVPNNASYCAYYDGVLWVGEFQYGNDYKTDRSHRMKTPDGYYQAWACGYVLDETQENEIKAEALTDGDAIPDYILETTERIQGITVKGDSIYLSQSYGRTNTSSLYRYDGILQKEADGTATVSEKEVPVWFLDQKKALSAVLFAPNMSECLCTVGDAIYVLFESGAETYLKGGSGNPMDRVFKLTDY